MHPLIDRRRMGRCTRAWIVVIASLGLAACNQSQTKDALIVAQRGKATTQDVGEYYKTLAREAKNDPFVLNLATENNIPLTDTDIKKGQQLSDEYAARAEVFGALSNLYDTLGQVAGKKPDDLQGAIGNLQTAVKGLTGQTLSGVAGLPADLVTGVVNKVTAFAFDMSRQHDLRKGNRDLEGIASTLDDLFTKEQGFYKATEQPEIQQQFTLAERLVDSGLALDADRLKEYVELTDIQVAPLPPTGPFKDAEIQRLKLQEPIAEAAAAHRCDGLKASLDNLVVAHTEFDQHQQIK